MPAVRKAESVTVSRQVSSSARLLSATSVCAFLDVSMDTLDRLLVDPDEAFPAPIRIRTSRYWTLGSLEKYVSRKQQQAEREDHR